MLVGLASSHPPSTRLGHHINQYCRVMDVTNIGQTAWIMRASSGPPCHQAKLIVKMLISERTHRTRYDSIVWAVSAAANRSGRQGSAVFNGLFDLHRSAQPGSACRVNRPSRPPSERIWFKFHVSDIPTGVQARPWSLLRARKRDTRKNRRWSTISVRQWIMTEIDEIQIRVSGSLSLIDFRQKTIVIYD